MITVTEKQAIRFVGKSHKIRGKRDISWIMFSRPTSLTKAMEGSLVNLNDSCEWAYVTKTKT